jgi:hypothetical protein
VGPAAPAAIYGVLLIILMYLMPLGVMGMVRKLWARWQPGAARLQGNVKPGTSVPLPPDLSKESTT